MIVGFIIELIVGTLCITFGLLIWKKQKLSLLHDYHYKNVKEEDISAYCKLMGIGLMTIGIGICLTGLYSLVFENLYGLLILLLGFVVGIIIISKAQKYNGSWL